ncbi:YfdQ family protein [Novosphingobium sp. 9]|uniref:YfdQ family protein n=1 Tax=Novosphingobium sp. 9 TaxID=2025349 RepID=UPI0021B5EB1F|nr:YfdQ family protein [Novosphingobium sp. 9]
MAPAENRRHKARYAFPLSEEWKAWFGQNASAMTMGDFAAFLETRIVDVSEDDVSQWSAQAQSFAKANRATTPTAIATPTRLVDMSLKFRIYETAESCEAVNLTSGEAQLSFVSDHRDADGKPVDFPKLFSITIPIFARSSVLYRIIARLRYRLQGGKPVFWYELWRPDLTFEAAFNEALDKVKEETALPIFAGQPEA